MNNFCQSQGTQWWWRAK
ncbi:trp operon leader peptide [uncultured Corynebacterium sp.]|nr:trp operon leader peptide [uncultured Corynebacterium sp.]